MKPECEDCGVELVKVADITDKTGVVVEYLECPLCQREYFRAEDDE